MSKCYEDFCNEIESQPNEACSEAFDVAASAMRMLFEPIADSGMSYRQCDLVLAGIASRTPRYSRERQLAIEQAALITGDVIVANAAKRLSRRLDLLDEVRQRIQNSHVV